MGVEEICVVEWQKKEGSTCIVGNGHDGKFIPLAQHTIPVQSKLDSASMRGALGDSLQQQFVGVLSMGVPKVRGLVIAEQVLPLEQSMAEDTLKKAMHESHSVHAGLPINLGVKLAGNFDWYLPAWTIHANQALLFGRFWPALAGFFALEGVASRSRREGVVLVLAEEEKVHAALIYAGALYGYWEQPVTWEKDLPAVLTELDSMRHGWLPAEKAALAGGFASVCQELPPEAEGFSPLYVAGVGAKYFSGAGRIVTPLKDAGSMSSWGLGSLLAEHFSP